MGALLQASKVTIWTDVDGVFSADPRKGIVLQVVSIFTLRLQNLVVRLRSRRLNILIVYAVSEAVVLPNLSYQEAWEMVSFAFGELLLREYRNFFSTSCLLLRFFLPFQMPICARSVWSKVVKGFNVLCSIYPNNYSCCF